VARPGPKPVDVTGRVFNHFKVLAQLPSASSRQQKCQVRCACGRISVKPKAIVTASRSKSCGHQCPLAWVDKRAKADARALSFLARHEAGVVMGTNNN